MKGCPEWMSSKYDSEVHGEHVTSEEEEGCGKARWILNLTSPEMTQTPLGELVICPLTDAKRLETVLSGQQHFPTTLHYEKGE